MYRQISLGKDFCWDYVLRVVFVFNYLMLEILVFVLYKSSVIRQKGESQSECFKKTKHANFVKNKHFLLPDTHTYVCVSGCKKCSFFGKFVVLCFLKTPVLRLALLFYYRRNLLTTCFVETQINRFSGHKKRSLLLLFSSVSSQTH